MHWIPVGSLLASTITNTYPTHSIAAARQKLEQQRRQWTTVTVDISSRLAPRRATLLRLGVRLLIGSMQFNAILLDPATESDPSHDEKSEKRTLEFDSGHRHQQLKLWGLSLGMTLDLLAFMDASPFAADYPRDEVTGMGISIAPSMT